MQLGVLTLVVALLFIGQAHAADDETTKPENLAHGYWLTDMGRSKVKVGPCDERSGLCTEIVWLREPNNSRGQPLTDGRNQNLRLRKRPIVGIKILEGLKQIGRYEWEGQVYNPEDGKTYSANLALVKPNMLRLKGCMPMGWPCRSKFWTRTEFEPPAPIEVAEEVVEVTVESDAPATADAADQPQSQPAPAAQAADQVGTASQEAPTALTPPPAQTPPPPAAMAEDAPSPAPPPPAAPKPSAPQIAASPAVPEAGDQTAPRQWASGPPQRNIAAPPPPPPPAVSVQASQRQRQAALAEPPTAPAAPPEPIQPAARSNVYPVPASPPPAAAQPPSRPQVDRDVAALPPARTPTRSGIGSNYLVQVAARQDRDEAVAVFNALRRRYPHLLRNTQPIIKRVNLGELGVWYRVRVGPIAGKAAALSFCNRLKFGGSDCFIRREQ